MQIGREGKNYFPKILPVKIQIQVQKRLEMSCATAMLQAAKKNWKECQDNHSVLCFQKLQKHKDKVIEEAATRRAEKKNSIYISTLS